MSLLSRQLAGEEGFEPSHDFSPNALAVRPLRPNLSILPYYIRLAGSSHLSYHLYSPSRHLICNVCSTWFSLLNRFTHNRHSLKRHCFIYRVWLSSVIGAGLGTRTRTPYLRHWILSPGRLPFRHSRMRLIVRHSRLNRREQNDTSLACYNLHNRCSQRFFQIHRLLYRFPIQTNRVHLLSQAQSQS